MCRTWYGGLASINSYMDLGHAGKACYDITRYPGAKDQHNHNGNWRGDACWIGLTKPYQYWNDNRKVTFKYWIPGQPDDGGLVRHCKRRESYRCGSWWSGYRTCSRCKQHGWRRRGNEHCVEMKNYNSRWNDLPCNYRRSCLCEDPRGQIGGKYIGVQAQKSYWGAHDYCKIHYGTELATITSDEENKEAAKLCYRIAHRGILKHCWIGLQRPFHGIIIFIFL